MSEAMGFYRKLSGLQRASLWAGMALIVGAFMALTWWALRMPKAVLFSDLADKDAAVLVAELDKLKVRYEISPDGHAILVPEDTVHKTRMTLMGRQLPLSGGVGFELFNNTDFGVSDFVQKVNYQRALQGELTRTILSMDQVQSARVHLTMPDPSLFKKDAQKAKASVTVVTKPGQSLQPGQVSGIQRLVAASVVDVKPDDVTVLDQHGVVLSRAMGEEGGAGAAQLDSKQALEQHLVQKAKQLLEKMFKPGDAMVTVDVVFSHQQSKVTTEEILAASAAPKGAHPAGVVVRERSTTRDTPNAEGAAPATAAVTSQEVDYQTGKRVEQVVSPSGQVSRINVAVVVRPTLPEVELARVRNLIATSVGLVPTRGDAIAIYSMADVSVGSRAEPAVDVSATVAPVAASLPTSRPAPEDGSGSMRIVWALLALLAVGMVVVAVWVGHQRGVGSAQGTATAHASLSAAERDELLASLQRWLGPASKGQT